MKKYKRQDLPKVLIDKMLESHGSSYEEVVANPEIDGTPWYQYYTWKSQEEVDKFKEFFIFTLTKQTTPKIALKQAEKEWGWFYLMYGLKEDFKHGKEFQETSSQQD